MAQLNFIKKFKKTYISFLILINFDLAIYPSDNNQKDCFYDFDDINNFVYDATNEGEQIKNLSERNEILENMLESKNAECIKAKNSLHQAINLVVIKGNVLQDNAAEAKRANHESAMLHLRALQSIKSKAHELRILEADSNIYFNNSTEIMQPDTSIEYIKNHNLFLRHSFYEMKKLTALQDNLLQKNEARASQAAHDSGIIIDYLMKSNNSQQIITKPQDSSNSSSSSSAHVSIPEKRKRGCPRNDSKLQSQKTPIELHAKQDTTPQRKSARLGEKSQKNFEKNDSEQEE